MEDVTYLWVAETVLRKHRRPLNARALVNYGMEDGLFPPVGLSSTPQKSMQARLSIEILNNGSSNFVRTRRGRFFLRELLPEASKDTPAKLRVYTAERHVPRPSSETVLCVPRQVYEQFLDFQGVGHLDGENPLQRLSENQFEYIARSVAETDDAYKQVVTYTIIQHQTKILSFRRGLYNRAATFLRGAQCVGFGGHVNEGDLDLFSRGDLGIRQNAAREISEELLLPDGPPRIDPGSLQFLGILNDNSSDVGVRHMAVVMRYWVDDWSRWRAVTKGESSITRLRWLDTIGEAINLSDFEYWSQLVMRSFFASSMRMVPSYKIQRRSVFREPHVLCVVGSIGSGKSATSRLFAERFGYEIVNSGNVLAGLLGIPGVSETGRANFQQKAEEFIQQPQGPARLGAALASASEASGSNRILIDGIRHPETLDALKASTSKPIALLYVYTPPDVAYEMYRYREGRHEEAISFEEFTKAYTAPVESRIRYMIGDADIITFNWLGLEAYETSISSLMKELHVD